MYGREPDLNDPFRPTNDKQFDREKIFKAWERLLQTKMLVLPPYESIGIVTLASKYKEKGKELMEQGQLVKGRGYIYFASLLLLKRALWIGNTNFVEEHRTLLRSIENTAKAEEELIPR